MLSKFKEIYRRPFSEKHSVVSRRHETTAYNTAQHRTTTSHIAQQHRTTSLIANYLRMIGRGNNKKKILNPKSLMTIEKVQILLIIIIFRGGGSAFCDVIFGGGVRRFVTTRDEGGGSKIGLKRVTSFIDGPLIITSIMLLN